MSKILVSYFSASGVTKRVATQLANVAGADLFEIEPVKPYTKADLNWMDKNARSTIEMKDKSSRPELADKNARIGDYDTIFIGFPIWWYIAPTIINTFLESYDFSGKTICPLITHGGSGFSNSLNDIKKLCPGANITEGLAINGDNAATCDKDVEKWLQKINLM